MKIVLCNCPNPILVSPEAHFQLGLLYVGGSLRKAGHDVSIVDLRAAKNIREEDIPEADVVGVTATSGEMHYAKQIAAIARMKGAKTMLGGAHATFVSMFKETEDSQRAFDLVIKGDGEIASVEALKLVEQNRSFPSAIPVIHPLPSLSGYFPDWSLIGERGFSRELFTGAGYGQGPLAAGILSSRGCPYHCSYCRSERERVRYRPIDDVLAEIIELQGRGIKYFRWYDESLTLSKSRALELFEALEPLKIHFRAHTRSDAWDDDLAKAAKKAGLEEMGLGFEAASDYVLEKVRKQEIVAQHREAVRVCKRHGILCKAFWMVGLPKEKREAIADIKMFMQDEKPDKWIVSLFAPYPGSDVWANPQEYGVTWMDPDLSHYWNFSKGPTISYRDNPRASIWHQYHDLQSWLKRCYPR